MTGETVLVRFGAGGSGGGVLLAVTCLGTGTGGGDIFVGDDICTDGGTAGGTGVICSDLTSKDVFDNMS